ncbi:hypothetical protein [Chromobacterium amazonense]|uniref:hypothetical protein n=1 Tax=Chromobacterium amazonense TaxID=1382803 RepID=UPI0031F6FACD
MLNEAGQEVQLIDRRLAIRRQERIGVGHAAAFQCLKRLVSINMCPKAWQAAGLSCHDLISALIELALERGRQDAALCRSAALPD